LSSARFSRLLSMSIAYCAIDILACCFPNIIFTDSEWGGGCFATITNP
jgi:hypothetical protein